MAKDEKHDGAPSFQTLSKRREEEEYFFHEDLEKVRRLRKKLDEEREKQRREQERQFHWMHCPKCGGQLQEQEQGKIRVDICGQCGGVYLDKGELELILKMEHKASFLERLSKRIDTFFTKGFDIHRSE